MKKSKNLIIVSDYLIYFIFNNSISNLKIPPGVIINGIIEDKNYLFYIINKFCRDNGIKNNIKTDVIIFTSKVDKIILDNISLNIKEKESYIHYELKSKISDLKEYNYIYFNNNEKINVFLMEKSIIDTYIEIFKSTDILINNFNSISTYFYNENIIIYTENGISINKNADFIKNYFNEDLSKFIIENKIFYDDLLYLKEVEDLSHNKELESIKSKYSILYNRLKEVLEFYIKSNENIKSYSLKKVINIINFNNENIKSFICKKGKKINIINYFLIVVIAALLFNSYVYINVKIKIKEEKYKINLLNKKNEKLKEYNKEKAVLVLENRDLLNKINKKSEKENTNSKNKEFLNIINLLDKSNLNISSYSYNNGIILIDGKEDIEDKIQNILNENNIKVNIEYKKGNLNN